VWQGSTFVLLGSCLCGMSACRQSLACLRNLFGLVEVWPRRLYSSPETDRFQLASWGSGCGSCCGMRLIIKSSVVAERCNRKR
jgi:hypothetical protein